MTNETTMGELKKITAGEYQAMARKRPRKKEEHRFEANLSIAASYMKCMYIKIPDPIYGSRRVREMKDGNDFKERRRPFDGIIVVNADDDHYGGIYAVEAKFGNNTLEDHQKQYLTLVHNINGMAYVIRCKHLKNMERYFIEWPEKNVLYETDNLGDFIAWFKALSKKKK